MELSIGGRVVQQADTGILPLPICIGKRINMFQMVYWAIVVVVGSGIGLMKLRSHELSAMISASDPKMNTANYKEASLRLVVPLLSVAR